MNMHNRTDVTDRRMDDSELESILQNSRGGCDKITNATLESIIFELRWLRSDEPSAACTCGGPHLVEHLSDCPARKPAAELRQVGWVCCNVRHGWDRFYCPKCKNMRPSLRGDVS